MSIFHYPVVNITGATGPTGPSGGPVGSTGPTGPTGPLSFPIAGQGIYVVTGGLGGVYTIDNTGVLTVSGTANQVYVSSLNGHVQLSLPQNLNIHSTVQFGDTTVNNLTVLGDLVSTTSSTLSVTDKIIYLANNAVNSSQADGGGLYLEGAQASILYSQMDDSWNFNKTINSGNIYASLLYSPFIHATANIHVGLDPVIDFASAPLQITSNYNSYQQVNNQNISDGTQASGDFIVTSNDGDDSNYYIDMGINSSNYSNPDYTTGGAHDGYLYVNGGNLSLGTQTGSQIVFHTRGTQSGNIVARFHDNRFIIGGITTSDDGSTLLQVAGNISANGSKVITFATLPNISILSTHLVSGSSYNINQDDYYVGVNHAGAVALTLPVGQTGQTVVVKDESGAASIYPITVSPQVGDSIEGSVNGSFEMNINNMGLTFIYRAGWRII